MPRTSKRPSRVPGSLCVCFGLTPRFILSRIHRAPARCCAQPIQTPAHVRRRCGHRRPHPAHRLVRLEIQLHRISRSAVSTGPVRIADAPPHQNKPEAAQQRNALAGRRHAPRLRIEPRKAHARKHFAQVPLDVRDAAKRCVVRARRMLTRELIPPCLPETGPGGTAKRCDQPAATPASAARVGSCRCGCDSRAPAPWRRAARRTSADPSDPRGSRA